MGEEVSLLKKYITDIVMFSVYQEPHVIKNFITHEECDFLISFENEKLKKSTVMGNLISPTRESFEKGHDCDSHEIITKIFNKCSKYTKKSIDFIEPLHIVKYKTGGYFNTHKDANKAYGFNRIYTIIAYLNDDYEGGETNFPILNKSYKLSKGDALFFHNYNTDLTDTSFSLHEGCVVKSAEKWVANIWIHSPSSIYPDRR